MLAIWNWLMNELSGTNWLWLIIAVLPFLLLGNAPLNWTSEKMTGAQVTTAQTSRTSTSPSNAVLLATGTTSKIRISGVEIQTTANIAASTAIFFFLSNDGGTTKYYLDEYPIQIFDITTQFKKPPSFVWTPRRGYVPLDGTNDKLYATIYTTDTMNLFPMQITY